MKIKNYILPVLMALFSVTVLQAQTADEIISKHIEAVGGKEKLSQVKSVYSECSMEVMGNQAPVTEYLLEGKAYKSESEFNGSKIIACYTDKSGWSINPMMGGDAAQSMPEGLYKSGKVQIYIDGALADYSSKGYKAELLGTEGGNFKLKLSNGDNDILYFIDPTSYFVVKSIIKSEMMGQPVDVTTTYSDYKKTDFGIFLPFTKNIDMGMFQIGEKVTKVEVNKDIDAKIFDMPK